MNQPSLFYLVGGVLPDITSIWVVDGLRSADNISDVVLLILAGFYWMILPYRTVSP